VTVCAWTFAADEKPAIQWMGYEQGLKLAKEKGRPTMIDVYTDWCGWCKVLDKEVYTKAEVIELSKSFVCIKVDGDKAKELVAKHQVKGYPTIFFTDKDGKEVHRIVGYEPAEKFLADMKAALEKVKGAEKK